MFLYNFINNLITLLFLSFKFSNLCFRSLTIISKGFFFQHCCLVIDIFSLELCEEHHFPMFF